MEIDMEYCAFIDILGFKNKMLNFEEALKYYESFFSVYEAFSKMHDSMIAGISDAAKELLRNERPKSVVNKYIFSDSIILSSPDWKDLLFRIAHVMSWLLSSGFLFRGGIGYGKHSSNTQSDRMYIVSEGLVQAVEIEGKVANYPRIVVSQATMDSITGQLGSLYDLNHLLIQSEDDLWFINPFFLNPDIQPICDMVNKKYVQYRNERFAEKYAWMGTLCNYFYIPGLVARHPDKYYSGEFLDELPFPLPFQPSGENNSKYKFFYPRFFSTYKLNIDIYKQTFQQNLELLCALNVASAD